MMHQLSLLIRHLNDTVKSIEDAKDVVNDFIYDLHLSLSGPPRPLENQRSNDFLYDFHSETVDHIQFYELVKLWCSHTGREGWMKIQEKDESDELQYQSRVYITVGELSIGNLLDPTTYVKHVDLWPSNTDKIRIDFEHDMQRISCFIITNDEWYKLSFDYKSVEGFVIGDIFLDNLYMYLPIKNPPKIWVASKAEVQSQHKRFYERSENKELGDKDLSKLFEDDAIKYLYWNRQNYVGDCKPDVFGSCSVFQFSISDQVKDNPSAPANFYHEQVIAGFIKHGYTVYFTSMRLAQDMPTFRVSEIEKLVKENPFKNSLNSSCVTFALRYGLLMLISKGTRFTDVFRVGSPLFTMLLDIIKNKLKNEDHISPLIKSFALLCNRIDQKRFLDLPKELEDIFTEELIKHAEKDVLAESNKNLFMVRRITVTPTRIIFQPPELNTSNRVLRESTNPNCFEERHDSDINIENKLYGPDNFVRVSFRDEDLSPLNLNKEYDQHDNTIIGRISGIFHKGIQIGEKGRRYHFLGCSNSQLRSSGAWFVVEEGNITVEKIRSWVGDFTKERSLSKYVSRLGLAFSSTETLKISAEEEKIDDILTEDEVYTFSDGIGKISIPIAEMIKEGREQLDYVPCAIQIRYGGCKGMVAIDPSLGSKEIIQIRPSMRKFLSNHKDIEFCQASKPSLLYMNRQVIWLLRGYYVKSEEFINLQNDTLIDLANSLKDAETASKNLMNYQGNGIYQQILDSGVDLTLEPFHRRQLLSLYRFHVKEVLTRTRIVMPADKGRQMLGVMDEYNILEYGEVFVQYSQEVALPMKNKVIKKGKLFITKNPCVHPGDLRTFTAVDVPELHHMCDVVVFPAKGKRPHPNELSGSDLDGDEYFVCWSDNLIPAMKNHEPGDYIGGETKKETEPITPEQLTDHVIRHVTKPNNLGRISVAHSVHCDRDPDGALCEKAKELAKQHSIAVDYPKTGIPEDFSKELRVYEYPDYLEKPDKPCYRSTSVIGDCNRICKSLYQVLGEQDAMFDLKDMKLDNRFIYKGYEQYLSQAVDFCTKYNSDLSILMSQYGLEDEGDIACGCLNKVKTSLDQEKKKNYEITEECVRFYRALQHKYSKLFFDEFDTKKGEWMEYKDECFKKASAWYLAAYKYYNTEGVFRLLSFPWCVSEVICELAKLSKNNPNIPKPESCTQIMANKMNKWFKQCQSKEPKENYTKTLEELHYFISKYNLIQIENKWFGLPATGWCITLATKQESKERPVNSLHDLQQDLFESNPGWDKSYLDLLGDKEVYLSVKYNPNITILADISYFEKLYTIRMYLETYPELQIPAFAVLKWCDINSLDRDLHVLSTDFVLLFIKVMIMQNQIKPVEVLKFNEKSDYLEIMKKPMKLVSEDSPQNPKAAVIYLAFFKSIIYGEAFDETKIKNKIKDKIPELFTKKVCSRINAQKTKYISYAMREYHETCYFLFNDEQENSDITRRRGKKSKMAKYKEKLCYPICHVPNLCAAHLKKHSNLEVNMRQIPDKHDNIIVIEVWGNTPEVLQDVTESVQILENPDKNFPAFKGNGKYVNVVGAYRIYLGSIQKKDDILSYRVVGPDGLYRSNKIESVLDFHEWEHLKNSCQMFLKERIEFLRTNHNVYSHGPLTATCEFGKFQPFANCCMKQGRHPSNWILYENTLQGDIDPKLLGALHQLGFREKSRYNRVKWYKLSQLYKKGVVVPVIVHCSGENRPKAPLKVDKLSWADMTWCEAHMFTERYGKNDAHNHRDLIFNISSCGTLMEHEIKDTKLKEWTDVQENINDNIEYVPNSIYVPGVGGALCDARLTNRALDDVDKDYSRLVMEDVQSFSLSHSDYNRLSKVKFDIITRRTKHYNGKGYTVQNKSKEADVSRHLVCTLPHFDMQSTGILSDFFEKICLRLH